jgi:phthiodiolone/phenolphthiodiolone dimycocerosates ketoreductase
METGILLPTVHPFTANSMTVELAEAAGVDRVWAFDHLLGMYHPRLWAQTGAAEVTPDPDACFDPFALLAALGQRSRLPMGVCVTDSSRRRAADVARSTLTLNQLCPGGFTVGVGCGEDESLVPFGYDRTRRVSRLAEFLPELKGMLDDGHLPGKPHARNAIPREAAAGPARLWVGGQGPRTLELAGRYGDGWIPANVSLEEFTAKRAQVLQVAREYGRRPPSIGLVVPIYLGSSRAGVLDAFDRNPLPKLFALQVKGSQWARHGATHPFGSTSQGFVDVTLHNQDPERLRAMAAEIPNEVAEEFCHVGNADDVAKSLRPYIDAGLDHAMFGNITGMLGGVAEAQATAGEFIRLCALLAGRTDPVGATPSGGQA